MIVVVVVVVMIIIRVKIRIRIIVDILRLFFLLYFFSAENALKDSRVAVGLCKIIVGCFSPTWKRRRDLAEELKLPEQKLKTECPTRWVSRQAMVQRILQQLPAISHVRKIGKILKSSKESITP